MLIGSVKWTWLTDAIVFQIFFTRHKASTPASGRPFECHKKLGRALARSRSAAVFDIRASKCRHCTRLPGRPLLPRRGPSSSPCCFKTRHGDVRYFFFRAPSFYFGLNIFAILFRRYWFTDSAVKTFL
ncbi:hypothetical protein EVAR_30081_1 [Eumeta japonica]|uniref:Uncharacterized protein n=1 Tax=Eumeta variegata TaxID=151549 RepID=A0A4C1XA77_EUMVA|nr:hypothetical protein EVAR_30081_1 [Eumeta japonica]